MMGWVQFPLPNKPAPFSGDPYEKLGPWHETDNGYVWEQKHPTGSTSGWCVKKWRIERDGFQLINGWLVQEVKV